MTRYGDQFFTVLNDDDRRWFVARDLRCNLQEPQTWPVSAIEFLIDVRRKDGKKAYRLRMLDERERRNPEQEGDGK